MEGKASVGYPLCLLRRLLPAADYLTRRLGEGKTKPGTIRTAQRHLTRHICGTPKRHPLR